MKKQLLTRYLKPSIEEDLPDRMVFLGGPRQVGKTTLALSFLENPSPSDPGYLNWDSTIARGRLMRGELPAGQKLIILDEIHKFARWRNLVKGFFDTMRDETSFIVTGSARLDYYRKGGDSLQGRYQHFRLHPLTSGEISSNPTGRDIEQLLDMGGFPEPFLKGSERFARRWRKERTERVVYDDLRDLERVREISLLDLLVQELPSRVASPLSVNSLSNVLQVAHSTLVRWLDILERLYFSYRIPPMSGKRIRAVKKEQKLYLWDWAQVPERGPRFENMVGSHLLKYCHHREDTEGYRMDLRFLRDSDGREVDFVVLEEGAPLFAVECKTGERDVGKAVRYFMERTDIPRFYQVHLGESDYVRHGIRVLPFRLLCEELALP